MNNDIKAQKTFTGKKAAIVSLTIIAGAITTIGILLSIYSILNDVSYNVMNNPVHGLIFGVVITYLGIRYLLSVKKLKAELAKPTSQFSFDNFRK